VYEKVTIEKLEAETGNKTVKWYSWFVPDSLSMKVILIYNHPLRGITALIRHHIIISLNWEHFISLTQDLTGYKAVRTFLSI
jgi:hypothetical protein